MCYYVELGCYLPNSDYNGLIIVLMREPSPADDIWVTSLINTTEVLLSASSRTNRPALLSKCFFFINETSIVAMLKSKEWFPGEYGLPMENTPRSMTCRLWAISTDMTISGAESRRDKRNRR
uniref:Uncharacterized protein n=1 Tax=Spongospora subterranea TaxID=70186 RepID=A0A0H5R6J5_9EUKA|eukprot:CRZ09743.1 hypothetical protein [Spongospora subterranea]